MKVDVQRGSEILGFCFTLRKVDDQRYLGATVEAECSQLGIVSMRGNHHHSALTEVRRREHEQAGFFPKCAMLDGERHAALSQGSTMMADVQIAFSGTRSLEIETFAVEYYMRVVEISQKTGVGRNFQNQRVAAGQRVGEAQLARLDAHSMCSGLFEPVLVILLRRVEQMVRAPGFVCNPKQRQEQPWQHPVKPACKDRQRQAAQAQEALSATILR